MRSINCSRRTTRSHRARPIRTSCPTSHICAELLPTSALFRMPEFGPTGSMESMATPRYGVVLLALASSFGVNAGAQPVPASALLPDPAFGDTWVYRVVDGFTDIEISAI